MKKPLLICITSGLLIYSSKTANGQGGQFFLPVSEQDLQQHTGAQINTGNEVGALAGSAGVSPIGAATYTVPLYVAPGTNGMQPSLAVTYNSNSGNGPLGYGWSLDGLSCITRVGRNPYNDQSCAPVLLDPNALSDRFVIDGERLVIIEEVDGHYGNDNTRYDTENAQFNVVTAHHGNTPSQGPMSFTRIMQASGTVMEYGGGAAEQYARVLSSNGTGMAYQWLLNKVTDPFGNYMTFTYSAENHPRLITGIDYTMNDAAGISRYNAVVFEYIDRPDVNETFVAYTGGPQYTKLLARVIMYCEGVAFKRYEFNYSTRDHGKSYLRDITEREMATNHIYNSTLIKYGDDGVQPWSNENTSLNASAEWDFTGGDFDGDGKSELLVSPVQQVGEDLTLRNTEFRVYDYDTENGLHLAWTSPTLPSASVLNSQQGSVYTYDANTLVDMNGDGRQDIVYATIEYDEEPFGILSISDIKAYISTGTPDNVSFEPISFGIQADVDDEVDVTDPGTHRTCYFIGDFNGDGFGDILYGDRLMSNGIYTVYLDSPMRRYADGTPAPLHAEVNFPEIYSLISADNTMVLDFDGDGASEILATNGYSSVIYELRQLDDHFVQIYGGGFPTKNHKLFPGDFNGDGKIDFLEEYADDREWHIQYFTSDGFFGVDYHSLDEENHPSYQFLDPGQVVVGDFDGDGMSDVAVWSHEGNQNSYYLYYSRGTNTEPEAVDVSSYPYNVECLLWNGDIINGGSYYSGPLLDFNGDNKADLLNVHDEIKRIIYFEPNEHARQVEKIVNGMGHMSSFEWRYATDPEAHVQGTDFNWPCGDIQFPLAVVKVSSASNGIGGMNSVEHIYQDAKANRRGKGFLGFMTHIYADVLSNRSVAESNELITNNGFGFLAPTARITARLSDGGLISIDDYTNVFQPWDGTGCKRYRHRVTATGQYDALAEVQTVTTNLEYNDYDRVVHSITDIGGVETVEITSEYQTFGPSTIPNRETSRTTKRTRGNTPITQAQKWLYYATTGAMERAENYSGQATPAWNYHQYDACGNLSSLLQGYDGCPLNDLKLENYVYDTKKRFVTRHEFSSNSTNVNALIGERFITEPKWGKVTKHGRFDGLTVEMGYDAFGRMTRVSAPYNAPTPRYDITTTRAWSIDEHPFELWSETTTDPSGPEAVNHMDMLGRPVRKESIGEFGTSFSELGYTSLGAVEWETSARFVGEDFVTTNHHYDDDYRRLTSDESSLSGVTSYHYDQGGGLSTTTVTDPSGKPHVQTLDAAGRMISAADNGGHLAYTYDSRGHLTQVSDGTVVLEQITYDEYGRQSQLTNADGGTTQYHYDGFSRLIWQKDANQNVTQSTYDNQDRILSRTEPEGTTSYVYFYSNGRFTDAPVSITDPHVTMTYAYNDPLNRLTAETQNTTGYSFGTTLTTTYTNDPVYDRLTKMVYPNGIQLRYNYFGDGSLDRITQGATTLFQASHINGQGQYDSYTKGDGITTDIEYSNGFPLRMSTPAVQDLRNTFDYQTGNLTTRCNMQLSVPMHEEFQYDFLDRLTKATVSTANSNGEADQFVAAYDYEYDGSEGNTKGNMTRRSDVGQFSHNTHAPRTAYGLSPYSPPDPPLVINYLKTQEVAYTSFSSTAMVQEEVAGDLYKLEYAYGTDHQRCHSRLDKNGAPIIERWYNGSFERQYDPVAHTTTDICYVNAGDGLSAMIVTKSNVTHRYYVYSDHLGSILYLTSNDDHDMTGIQAAQNFDAWGRRRNPETWLYDNVPAVPAWLYRGYTGHEHVDPFVLVNMNGRMYDPLNGRLLSVDNFVSSSTSSQAYNRYSYALNNPLKYTDPNGEFVHIIIGAAIGGLVNLGVHLWNSGGEMTGSDMWEAFGVGAIAGGIGAATGGAAFLAAGGGAAGAGGFLAGAGSGMMGAAVSAPILSGGNEYFLGDQPMTPGQYGMAILGGGILGGALNGLSAAANGRSFWNGSVPAGTFDPSVIPQLPRTSPSSSSSGSSPGSSGQQRGNISTEKPILTEFDEMGVNGNGTPLGSPVPNQYRFTQTVANHLEERVLSGQYRGEFVRPYLRSPLTIQEIMSTGPGAADASYIGGLNWAVPGTFRGSLGTWQLGLHPESNVIYHFNFVRP